MPFDQMDTAMGFGAAPNKLTPATGLSGTSLPPNVDSGEHENSTLRACFPYLTALLRFAAVAGELRLGVGAVSWTTAYHPGTTMARVLWWGERGRGLSLPLDNQSPAWATFAIRSTPPKFAAYLKDVGKLQIEIENAEDSSVVGTVEVAVNTLSNGTDLDEWVPILGFDRKSLGQVRVIAKITVDFSTSLLRQSPDPDAFVFLRCSRPCSHPNSLGLRSNMIVLAVPQPARNPLLQT